MFIFSLLKTFIFIILFIYFIYVFLAALGPRCCMGFSLVEVRWGFSLVVVLWLPIAVASLVVEHGF